MRAVSIKMVAAATKVGAIAREKGRLETRTQEKPAFKRAAGKREPRRTEHDRSGKWEGNQERESWKQKEEMISREKCSAERNAKERSSDVSWEATGRGNWESIHRETEG